MNSERYLHDVYSALKDEVRSGHGLLEQFERSISARLVLADLLRAVVGDASIALEEVKTIAVALELMRFGADLHYGKEETSNLSLIAADYYYARAISLASSLPNIRAVDALSRAIAEIASAEVAAVVGEAERDVFERRAGLFAAAGEIGAALADCENSLVYAISAFGRSAGVVYLADAGWGPLGAREKLDRRSVEREAGRMLEKMENAPSIASALSRYLGGLSGEGRVC